MKRRAYDVFDTGQSVTPYGEGPVRELWDGRKRDLERGGLLTENLKVGDRVVIDMDKPFRADGDKYPVECEVKGIETFEYKYVAVLESADGRRFLATRPIEGASEPLPGWDNHGDVGHYDYGGLFIRQDPKDPDKYHVIETTNWWEQHGQGSHKNEWTIRHGVEYLSELKRDHGDQIMDLLQKSQGNTSASPQDFIEEWIRYTGFNEDAQVSGTGEEEYSRALLEMANRYVPGGTSATASRRASTRSASRTVRANVSELGKILEEAEYSNRVYDVGDTIRTSDGSTYTVLGVTEMAYHLRDESGWEMMVQRPFVDPYGEPLPTFEEGKGARVSSRSAATRRWVTVYSDKKKGIIFVPAKMLPHSPGHGMFFATPSIEIPYDERKPDRSFRSLWDAGNYLGISEDELKSAWAKFPESASEPETDSPYSRGMGWPGQDYDASSHACAECARPLRRGSKVWDDGEHIFCSERCATAARGNGKNGGSRGR